MDHQRLKHAIECGQIEWQKHALERMIERRISREAVKHVISTGSAIEDYPDDKPFPSSLIMGLFHEKPLHVVSAFDYSTGWIFIITAYEPDMDHFEPDYKTRRKK